MDRGRRSSRGLRIVALTGLLALVTTGCTLFTWGSDQFAQLGDGSPGDTSDVPTQVGSATTWATISGGGLHTCAIRGTNTLWCWGNNTWGQLGDGTSTGSQATPKQIGTATDWKQIEAGRTHTCGIRADASLWCWGQNFSGQVGDGTTTERTTPTKVDDASWVAVSAGGDHTCGIRADASLWCWGENGSGELGDGTTTDRLIPTAIGTASWSDVAAGLGTTVTGGHTCGIRATGSLWCWGDNGSGEVGDGTTTTRTEPTLVNPSTWEQVATGARHSCAILTLGEALLCWGSNQHGELGDGTTTNRTVPTFVALGERFDWRSVSLGDQHSCGVKVGNLLRCWGENDDGQLGDNTTTSRSVPTAPSLPTDWVFVDAGAAHTAGLRL